MLVSTFHISWTEVVFFGENHAYICKILTKFTRLILGRTLSLIVVYKKTFGALNHCNFPSRLIFLGRNNNV